MFSTVAGCKTPRFLSIRLLSVNRVRVCVAGQIVLGPWCLLRRHVQHTRSKLHCCTRFCTVKIVQIAVPIGNVKNTNRIKLLQYNYVAVGAVILTEGDDFETYATTNISVTSTLCTPVCKRVWVLHAWNVAGKKPDRVNVHGNESHDRQLRYYCVTQKYRN